MALFRVARTLYAGSPIESTVSLYPSDRDEVSEGFSVDIASTAQAVEGLCSAWRGWTRSLETDIDYYLHILKSDSTVLRPHVTVVYKDGIAQAMLVGLVRRRRASTIVSFVRLRGPHATVLEIVNGGSIGQRSPTIDRLMALELLKTLQGGQVDLVSFRRLPLHSELFHQLQRLPGLLVRTRISHVLHYTVLSQAASEGSPTAVSSGKSKRGLRRKARLLQRAFPGSVRLECYARPGDLDVGIRDAFAVAATTWQSYLGCCGLSDSPEAHEDFEFLAGKGWLRIYVLYVENIPRAFLTGLLHNQIFYCQHAGYDPNLARFSVGSLLTGSVVENLAAVGVQQVDLGEGGQEHNRRLGCKLQHEGTVHVYSPTWRGFSLNIFFASTQIVRAAGRKAREGLRLAWASRIWKELLMADWRRQNLHQNPLLQATPTRTKQNDNEYYTS